MKNSNRFQEVIRYVRVPVYIGPWVEGISNMGGITVIFRIDYETGNVGAKWSVATPDVNFSRKLGYAHAANRDTMVLFTLDDVKHYGGLVNALVAKAIREQNSDLNDEEFDEQFEEKVAYDEKLKYLMLQFTARRIFGKK